MGPPLSASQPNRATRNSKISTFCHHILFFSSVEAGEEWARASDVGAFVLTLAQAFELGRLFNRLRFGLD